MSKAKAIGTKAETAVRNYLLESGYSELEAHRNVLTGSEDQGDVWLREPNHGLMVFELKGGKAAKDASYEQAKKWLKEAHKEAHHAKSKFGFLVTQRSGFGYPRAGEWWAFTTIQDIAYLRFNLEVQDETVLRITLNDLVRIIRG